MSKPKDATKPYGPPRWWESASGAPLAYLLVLGGLLAALVLLKKFLTLTGLV